MKITITVVLIYFVLLNPIQAKAEFTHAKCSYALFASGEIQVNRQWFENSSNCFIDIHPRNVVDMKYRDYYFDNHGHFMVFNAYGNGPESQMTAARDFFTFPQVEDYPDYSVEDNGDVIVKMTSGHLFRISAKDFSIVSITPGTFIEKPLSAKNDGGVEINLTQGFWIDGGFQKGSSRMGNPNLKSTIKSSQSDGSCEVLNSDILNYNNDGDYSFKYENQNLVEFLKTKCKGMRF